MVGYAPRVLAAQVGQAGCRPQPRGEVKRRPSGAFQMLLRSSRSDSSAFGTMALGSESDQQAGRHYFRETRFLCCLNAGRDSTGTLPRSMRTCSPQLQDIPV